MFYLLCAGYTIEGASIISIDILGYFQGFFQRQYQSTVKTF